VYGLCIPDSCTEADLEVALVEYFGSDDVNNFILVNECHSKERPELDGADVAYMYVMLSMV